MVVGCAKNADNVDGVGDDYTANMYADYDLCMSADVLSFHFTIPL